PGNWPKTSGNWACATRNKHEKTQRDALLEDTECSQRIAVDRQDVRLARLAGGHRQQALDGERLGGEIRQLLSRPSELADAGGDTDRRAEALHRRDPTLGSLLLRAAADVLPQ